MLQSWSHTVPEPEPPHPSDHQHSFFAQKEMRLLDQSKTWNPPDIHQDMMADEHPALIIHVYLKRMEGTKEMEDFLKSFERTKGLGFGKKNK